MAVDMYREDNFIPVSYNPVFLPNITYNTGTWAMYASTGATAQLTPGGAWIHNSSVGSYDEFEFPVYLPPGTYTCLMGLYASTNVGRLELFFDDTRMFSADYYYTSPGWTNAYVKAMPSPYITNYQAIKHKGGKAIITVKGNGKNPSSSGSNLSISYFTFVADDDDWFPTGDNDGAENFNQTHVQPITITAGNSHSASNTTFTRYFGPDVYGLGALYNSTSAQGDWIAYKISVPETGTYDLVQAGYEAASCAIVQYLVDDVEVARVDCYANTPLGPGRRTVSDIHLTAGEHTLKLVAVDKNAASSAYQFGVSHIQFTPKDIESVTYPQQAAYPVDLPHGAFQPPWRNLTEAWYGGGNASYFYWHAVMAGTSADISDAGKLVGYYVPTRPGTFKVGMACETGTGAEGTCRFRLGSTLVGSSIDFYALRSGGANGFNLQTPVTTGLAGGISLLRSEVTGKDSSASNFVTRWTGIAVSRT